MNYIHYVSVKDTSDPVGSKGDPAVCARRMDPFLKKMAAKPVNKFVYFKEVCRAHNP
jgi:hypothetical protein